MVNSEIVKLIQDTIDDLQDSTSLIYNSKYDGYEVIIHDEVDFQFKENTPKLIEASLQFGSAQKNNDLEDKYTMSFVVNIFSEVNGYDIAKSLFNDVFKLLTRTYQTLGTYNSKIFFTSPVIMNPYAELGDNFVCLMTMNGSVEFSERVVLGSKYELSLNGVDFIEVKPRQPYILKEAMGGNDLNYSNPSEVKFTKSGNVLTINMVVLYEKIIKNTLTTAETNFNTLFNQLLNECYGASSQSYTLKDSTGTGTSAVVKTITGLTCVRAQKIYDETTGENVLSLQFKVGA